MPAVSVKPWILPRFLADGSVMVFLAVFVALAIALGDFAALRPDSPPARAAALTAPDGGSARTSSSQAPNRLTSASLRSTSVYQPDLSVDGRATYRYDALGRRVQKTVYGRSTTFIHDGEQVIQERDGPPTVPEDSAQALDDGTGAGDPPGGALIADALIRVNFQPVTSLIPDGFVADKGRLVAERTNGWSYGWEAARPSANAVVRGVYPYPQWDTHQRSVDGTAATQANTGTWRIGLENGTYAVVLVMGDPITMNQTNDVRLNGTLLTDLTPAVAAASSTLERGAFDGYAVTATVTDGTLTITVPPSAKDSKLCFIEIGAKGSVADAALEERVRSAVAQANRLTDQEFPPQVPSPRILVYGSYVDEPLLMEAGTAPTAQRFYLHANHLFSIAALTDATGAVVERYGYDAMGSRTVFDADGRTPLAWSAVGNQTGFTGRYHDDETGLQYFRSRMYSASLGRFISRDSAGYVNGMGLYGAYFIPNRVDPSGNVAECAEDAFNFDSEMIEGLLAAAAIMEADSYGVFDPQPSVYQASMVASRYLGLSDQDAYSIAMEQQEMAGFAGSDALTPFYFISSSYELAREKAYYAYRQDWMMAKARSNYAESVNELYEMGLDMASTWGPVAGSFAAGGIVSGIARGTFSAIGRAMASTAGSAAGAASRLAGSGRLNPFNYQVYSKGLGSNFGNVGVRFKAAKATPSLDALSQAAGAADRGGLTAAGRSLTKHGAGARPGNSLFPSATGNPTTINQAAQNVVDDILTTPGSTFQNSVRGRFGPTIEITAPGGRGMVYDANGKFLFFKE